MQYPGLPEDYEQHTSTDGLPCSLLHSLSGHEGPVFAVRYNPAGTYCLSCGKDRKICLWNPVKGVLVKSYMGHGYEVRDVSVATDNSKFASCGGDKQGPGRKADVKSWKIRDQKLSAGSRLETETELQRQSSPPAAFAASRAFGGSVAVSESLGLLADQTSQSSLVQKFGTDFSDLLLIVRNAEQTSLAPEVLIWDVASGAFIRKLRGHDSTINAVKYTADDEVLVTAGYDQSIKLWDCKSRSTDAMQVMKAFKDSVTSVVVRGWEITAGSVDGTVRRFDVRMGRVYVDELHQPVTSVAVSRDGLCTLAACLDSTLRLLDKASGQLLASYKGHMHQAVKMDCCFTPSDAQVVGSSETGEILYWDLVVGSVVKRFEAHSGMVCSLAMHPEGNQMVTSSLDGVVKVWVPSKQ